MGLHLREPRVADEAVPRVRSFTPGSSRYRTRRGKQMTRVGSAAEKGGKVWTLSARLPAFVFSCLHALPVAMLCAATSAASAQAAPGGTIKVPAVVRKAVASRFPAA